MISYRQLATEENELAVQALQVIAIAFESGHRPLSDDELTRLLLRPGFRLFAALADNDRVVGAITAYELLGSDYRSAELLLWDVAVLPSHQRQGIGAALIDAVRVWCHSQSASLMLVMAEGDDVDAIRFYRALPQATEQAVRLFSYLPLAES